MTALISGRLPPIFGAAVLAAAMLCAVPAVAQDTPDQELPPPPPRPLQLVRDQLTEPAARPANTVDISMGELAAPNRDQIGLVDALSGGFPVTLWQGSELETLRKILPQLPTRMTSPAQRRLAENLLLSSGSTPASVNGNLSLSEFSQGSPTLAASQWLLETRIIQLEAMGAWHDALAMIELVPLTNITRTLRRLRADAYLITGRVGDACGDTRVALSRAPDIHWQKMQVFCHLVNGQTSAADLGLSLLREQQADDATYFWAAELMRGGKPDSPVTLGAPTPLLIAMLRVANVPAPDVLIRSGDATAFGVLAALPHPEQEAGGDKRSDAEKQEMHRAAAEAQMLLAERAVSVGTLPPERLRTLYRELAIDEGEAPSLSEISSTDVRGRARLFQSALAQTVPTARAEVIAHALEIARADMGGTGPSLSTVGMVYAPLMAGIAPSADMIWFAGAATRGLLAAGEADGAREWLELVRTMARTSGEALSLADGLWPLERLLTPGAKGRLPTPAMEAWAASVSDDVAAQGREILLNLFTAFGDPVTTADWQSVMDSRRIVEHGPSVAPHIWNGMSLAAGERRVGESAVLALIALGDEGPAFAAPETLAKVIATLMAAGREQDARALAVEAALALGL